MSQLVRAAAIAALAAVNLISAAGSNPVAHFGEYSSAFALSRR